MNKLPLAFAFVLVAFSVLGVNALLDKDDELKQADALTPDPRNSQVSQPRPEPKLTTPPLGTAEPREPAVANSEEPSEIAPLPADIPLLGKAVATLEDGELFVDGVPFKDLDLDAMEMGDLKRLKKGIGVVFRSVKDDFITANSVESMFVSNDFYQANRMWHDDLVLWSAQRPSFDEDGKEVWEYGCLNVTKGMSPDGYTLKHAVIQVHKASAYAAHLTKEGRAVQERHAGTNSNVIWDITDDLTHWVGTSPDGQIVGWYSTSTVDHM